ncbi:MAG: Crossover junction endodeoxyribonuclease RuvC [Parcubacteria group bacterium GW2011_GWF2_39_13b]|nr:MAG: Crossover junction endodeoxyribonuclease RuvC [Parcubacteria group bacterium GW2011_GWF2_39_13b]
MEISSLFEIEILTFGFFMIILGIDPGTATTGFGIIKKTDKGKKAVNGFGFEYLAHGVIKTTTDFSAADRLNKIHIELNKILKTHQPAIVAVESLFFFKNLKTALPVSQARGVILMTLAKKRLPIHEFTPLQMKMIVAGYGRAEKKQVQETIKRLLALKEIPRPDDAADALGIAICCALKVTNYIPPGHKKLKKSK